ncbi:MULTISPECIES: hypothetical protein [unclassified Streptomyces]|uniref:hypothetical protein n=1 Tax=unclassified Streptomyces TaxID=2593676 RepID=UPI002D21D431|nr:MULTISPECIES: hypothetical protein [unclassified Streptomyces]
MDSANHRTHVAFADADGNCANGFKAIPRLTMRLVYEVPAPTVENGRVKNAYAVDGFPEQLHKPINDHDDFINIMDEKLMDEMVDCLNAGRTCGAGAPPATEPGDDKGGDQGGNGGGKGGQDNGAGKGDNSDKGNDTGSQDEQNGKDGKAGEDAQNGTKGSGGDAVKGGGNTGADTPKTESTVASDAQRSEATEAPTGSASPSAVSRAEGTDDQDTVGSNPAPQAEGSQGSLAETGSQLWPAAAGALMLCAGLVVLLRSRRYTARR